MKSQNIIIKPGDHSKELKRAHRLLLPQELKGRTQKKISDYEAAKRWKLREEIIALVKAVEEQGIRMDDAINLVQEYKPTKRRQAQGGLFDSQYPI